MESSASAPLPVYKCHKEVCALKIKQVVLRTRDAYELHFEESFAPIVVPKEWVDKHNPKAGGYWVKYDDGYTSFSPAKSFEEGYTRIDAKSHTKMGMYGETPKVFIGKFSISQQGEQVWIDNGEGEGMACFPEDAIREYFDKNF